MLQRLKNRVALLEARQAAAVASVLDEAYLRLSHALREAVPPLPAVTETKQIGPGCSQLVFVSIGRAYEHLLKDLSGRIDAGTLSDADLAVLAGLDAGDLATVEQSAEQFVRSMAELLTRFDDCYF